MTKVLCGDDLGGEYRTVQEACKDLFGVGDDGEFSQPP